MNDLYAINEAEDRDQLEEVCINAYETRNVLKIKKAKSIEDRLKYSTMLRKADQ